MRTSKKNPKAISAKKNNFDAQAFLDSAGVARKVKEFQKGDAVYAQGDPATSVIYLQAGTIRLSVVNESGKEAVVAIIGPGDFFGEGCVSSHLKCNRRGQRRAI